jgi:hypothetical protein
MYISKSFTGMYNGVALETSSVVEAVRYSGVLPVSGTPDLVYWHRIRSQTSYFILLIKYLIKSNLTFQSNMELSLSVSNKTCTALELCKLSQAKTRWNYLRGWPFESR